MQPIPPKARAGFRAVVFAEDQPEYLKLPANYNGHRAETVWKMSLWERLKVLVRGVIYVDILTFGKPLQPIRVAVFPDVIEGDPDIDPLDPEDMPSCQP